MKGSEMGAIRSTKGHKTMNIKRHPLTGTPGRRQDNIKWIFGKTGCGDVHVVGSQTMFVNTTVKLSSSVNVMTLMASC